LQSAFVAQGNAHWSVTRLHLDSAEFVQSVGPMH